MNSLSRKLRKNFKDNQGMALVTVIVAIGFIAALVSILLTTTLVNFKMKVVNERGKDTFYSAEQVLDEISVGLQRRVSDSLSASYTYVLENYGDYSNDQKDQMIQTHYYNKLWGYLAPDGDLTHQKYDVTKLEAFLKDTTKWHEYNTSSGESGSGDGYGAIVVAVSFNSSTGEDEETKLGDMYTYSGSGIVLKNVKVYYKDIYGFVSVIQTDIRLGYPGFEFARNSAMADVTNYCFIADGGVTRSGAGGNLNIDGNIYANCFETKNVNTTIAEDNLVVVKHDISVENNSFKCEEGTTLWAKDIRARSATVDINGSVNLSNDLSLMGNSPKAIIAGTYAGYGNSMTTAEESSAILINGKNSTLDFSRVRDMKLYGHAYLGLSAAENYPEQFVDETTTPTVEKFKNLITGESIAVKPDQLMYLVPAEAIGVDLKTGYSMYNENPMTKAHYNKLKAAIESDEANTTSATQYTWIADEKGISSLGGGKLLDYIAYETGKPKIYQHEVRVSDGTTNSLVYFYMLFSEKQITDETGAVTTIPAEQVANNYFQIYYQNNKDISERYADIYIDKITLPNLREAFVTRAGYSYVNQIVDGRDTLGIWAETQVNVNEKKNTDREANDLIFRAYTTKLIPNTSELGTVRKVPDPDSFKEENKDKPDGQVVFENVLKVPEDPSIYTDLDGRVLEYINTAEAVGADGEEYGGVTVSISGSGDNKKMAMIDSEGNQTIISTLGETLVSDNKIHLVIATGDVSVTATNFEGVILCNGKVNLSGTAEQSFTKNSELVAKCLQFAFEDGMKTHAVASCLEGGNDYIYSSYGDSYSGATSLEGLVTYENWKKE